MTLSAFDYVGGAGPRDYVDTVEGFSTKTPNFNTVTRDSICRRSIITLNVHPMAAKSPPSSPKSGVKKTAPRKPGMPI